MGRHAGIHDGEIVLEMLLQRLDSPLPSVPVVADDDDWAGRPCAKLLEEPKQRIRLVCHSPGLDEVLPVENEFLISLRAEHGQFDELIVGSAGIWVEVGLDLLVIGPVEPVVFEIALDLITGIEASHPSILTEPVDLRQLVVD